MSQEEQKVPKIFFSYSWTTEEHKDWVVELAQRLEKLGFHIILDRWNLKPGQDKYSFMESSVRATDVDRVLIILDKGYATKADERRGGVGTESQIISPSIYDSVNETKFLPIVRERDEEGEPYSPIFLRSRLYIDFSEDDKFEERLDELVRDLLNKPTHKRPVRGVLPVFSDDEDVKVNDKTRILVRGIDTILSKRPERVHSAIEDFLNAFIESLPQLAIKITDTSDRAISKLIIDSIEEYTPLRDDFVRFFEKIIKNGQHIDADLMIDFFTKLMDFTEPKGGSYREVEFENYKFIIHELFLSTIGLLLKNSQYSLLEDLLYTKYNTPRSQLLNQRVNYATFFQPLRSIDVYYKELMGRDLAIPLGTLMYERANPSVTKSALVEADILCFHIHEMNIKPNRNTYDYKDWYPVTFIYQAHSSLDIFRKLVSRRFYDKVKGIYDVKTPQELSDKIRSYAELKENRQIHSGSGHILQPLDHLINPDTIAIER